jgi:translation initiation factor IF-2
MSESNDAADKTLRAGARKPLSLNRTVESGHVQQKFSHGRSKSVVVEKKRKRLLTGSEADEAPLAAPVAEVPKPAPHRPTPSSSARPTASPGPSQASSQAPQRILSDREQAARAVALTAAAERRVLEAAEAERQRIEAEEDTARADAAAEAAAAEAATAEAAAAAEAAVSPQAVPEAPQAVAEAPIAETAPQAAIEEAAPQPTTTAVDLAPVAAPPSEEPDAAPTAETPVAAPVAAPPLTPRIVSPPPPVQRPAPAPAQRPATPAAPGQQLRPAASQQRPQQTPRPDQRAPFRSSDGGQQNRQGASPNRFTTNPPRPGEGPRPTGPARVPPRVEATSTQPAYKPVGMTRPMIVSRTDRPSPKPPEPIKKGEEVTQLKRAPRPTTQPTTDLSDDDDRNKKRGGVPAKGAPRTPGKGEGDRVRGKLTITNAFDESQRQRSLASLKRRREREKLKAMGVQQPRDKVMREVTIPEAITIADLANRMTERAVDVIKLLMKQGAMHKINDVIDADTAELIVTEFGHTAKRVSEADVLEGFIGEKDLDEATEPRAPVVTIMGHVDHGKTSLLDAIRHANVASGEAGGITQHIGAYQVVTEDGHKITFIDTPGHEAFTAMRARGAKVTDIVVLVVAADDGVMPQTIEAINHAKAAKVPIIVAINKIDKPDADPKRVATELLQHEIVVESMSGDVLDVPVSAIKGTGLDKLLEAIVLQAEILELKANPNRTANGYVIEAKLERGRGPVGTVLVERGTLRVGDIVVAGAAWGRVRALIDDKGANVKEAGPAVPVEVLGFDSAPEAGDEFSVVESEARAREITDYRVRKRRDTLGSAGTPRTLEAMMAQLKDADRKEFPLVIKGDVQGSVEAIIGSLKKISTDEVQARLIHTGVGGITESDVALANASKAIVIGFNVRANSQAKQLADSHGLEIRYYNIIYDLVDEVKAAMSGLLAPTRKEVMLGHATLKQVFNISKVGKIAGAQVTDGKVERGARLRLIRDNVVILQEGKLSTLKRFKDDVREVVSGQECGIAFENFQDLKEGDVIECYQVEIIKRSL